MALEPSSGVVSMAGVITLEAEGHEVRKRALFLGRQLWPVSAGHAKCLEAYGAAPKVTAAFGAADAGVDTGWVERITVAGKRV